MKYPLLFFNDNHLVSVLNDQSWLNKWSLKGIQKGEFFGSRIVDSTNHLYIVRDIEIIKTHFDIISFAKVAKVKLTFSEKPTQLSLAELKDMVCSEVVQIPELYDEATTYEDVHDLALKIQESNTVVEIIHLLR